MKDKGRFLPMVPLMNFGGQHTITDSAATSMNWNELYPKPRQGRAQLHDKTHGQSQTTGALAKIQHLAVLNNLQLPGVTFIRDPSNPCFTSYYVSVAWALDQLT